MEGARQQGARALEQHGGNLFSGPTRKIHDDIWGDIPINRALLETRAMERLKGMRQLGFADAAFPAAKCQAMSDFTSIAIAEAKRFAALQANFAATAGNGVPRRTSLPRANC